MNVKIYVCVVLKIFTLVVEGLLPWHVPNSGPASAVAISKPGTVAENYFRSAAAILENC